MTVLPETLDGATVRRLRRSVLSWYATERRDFPWRETRDPYAVLVSEVMLQQTQAARVAPRFVRFMTRFPTAAALARPRAQRCSPSGAGWATTAGR